MVAKISSPTQRRTIIPRARLFGNPTHFQAKLSPDGRWLSWLAPQAGVLNILVAPTAELSAARVITNDTKRGIRGYVWAPSSNHVLYRQDEDGNEEWHIHAVNVVEGTARNLTPFSGVTADVNGLSIDEPETVALAINHRDKAWHDIYCVDIRTGERELLFENREQLASIVLDCQIRPRLAIKARPEGGSNIYRLTGTRLDLMREIAHEDDLTTHVQGFTRDGSTLYLISSEDRDKAVLRAIDWQTGTEEILAEHPEADISRVLLHPNTKVADAAVAEYLNVDWIALDQRVADALKQLQARVPGTVDIVDRIKDDSRWLILSSSAETPGAYYLYERDKTTVTELFEIHPDLKSYHLVPMMPQIITARDGLKLVSHLTLPKDGTRPLPTVLLVHGGPWFRDRYGYNAKHQWLADRGYAVLSVNFRGSRGFGKAFTNAGDLEWGRKMQDDLLDGVEWAVAQGIADRDRIAIMGMSYGGYATLAGLAFTPAVFCCGVDIVGPSNLETFLASVPPYWASAMDEMARRVGDLRTEKGRTLLRERSPLHAAAQISKPLLIGQGANDPRIRQAESDQIVAAMQTQNLPVTYVLYPNEGHGFAVPENALSFNAVSEAFLALHLGGRCEPFGEDLRGAEFQVRAGAEHVPGLTDALAMRRRPIGEAHARDRRG